MHLIEFRILKEQEIDRLMADASAVMRKLYRSNVVKTEVRLRNVSVSPQISWWNGLGRGSNLFPGPR